MNDQPLLEVERRYRLHDGEVSWLVARLNGLGFKQLAQELQTDIYYTSTFRDFIDSRECLRIRTTSKGSVLTWKPPTSDAMVDEADYWKEEIDVRIDGQVDAVRRLLAALCLLEYVTVSKHRRIFSSTTDGVEVAIDTVEDVGIFVEIEIRSKDVPAARALIGRLATELELNDAMLSTTPYRDLVKESIREG